MLPLLMLAVGAAAPESVFGIPFGQPISLPVCSADQPGTFSPFPAVTCQDPIAVEQSPGRKGVNVRFSQSDLPPFCKDGTISVTLLQDKVAGFLIQTGGIEDQSIALNRLTEKYGKPDTTLASDIKNMVGGSFQSINATWHSRGLTVTLLGTTTTLKHGLITINDPAAQAIRDAAIRQPLGKAL